MRPFNFSAGPSTIPEPVLKQAQQEMLDWQGMGVSVMEVSHRSPEFMKVYETAVANLRTLLKLSEDYEVLLMHGGAVGENAIVPLNLSRGQKADYVITGLWSNKSAKEAQKYCDVHVAADMSATGFTQISDYARWDLRKDSQYLHICANETVHGVEFAQDPPDLGVALVADMSSNILSRQVDCSRYALIYGGAQKNVGQAGVTIVIVRKDCLGKALAHCPSAFDYQVVAQNQSMYNTPPTFAIYILGLTLQWVLQQGGVQEMEKRAQLRSQMLYNCIDASDFYINKVDKSVRSRMNVTFFLADETLNSAFLQGAYEHQLLFLKGHKAVGGMRASIYNAMPLAGVEALVEYMRWFEKQHG